MFIFDLAALRVDIIFNYELLVLNYLEREGLRKSLREPPDRSEG